MICRPAKAGDIPWLVETTVETYRTVFAPLLPDCDWAMFDEGWFEERFRRQWVDVVIAVASGQRQGFCLMTGSNIDMLFVAGPRRRQGCGLELLRHAEARGARKLECFAVNTIARVFYERHGWVQVTRHRRLFAGAACDFIGYGKG